MLNVLTVIDFSVVMFLHTHRDKNSLFNFLNLKSS